MKRSAGTPYFAQRKGGPPGSFRRREGVSAASADARPAAPAQSPVDHDADHEDPSLLRNPRVWIPAGLVAVAVLLVLIRLAGLVRWSFWIVLAPFTFIGVAVVVIYAGFLTRQRIAMFRSGGVGTTPAPERLDPPEAGFTPRARTARRVRDRRPARRAAP